jgi:hypothetical protein
MSQSSFPIFAGQPGFKLDIMTVTGASVSSSTQSSAGLDNRGKFLCTCQSNGANQVTVQFLSAYGDVPNIVPVPLTANVGVDLSSVTKSGFVYTTVKRDDHTTGVNNADLTFFIVGPNTTAAFQ